MNNLLQCAFIGTMHSEDLSEDVIIDILQECINGGIDIHQSESKFLADMIYRKNINVVKFIASISDISKYINWDHIGYYITVDIINILIENGADPFSNNNELFKNSLTNYDLLKYLIELNPKICNDDNLIMRSFSILNTYYIGGTHIYKSKTSILIKELLLKFGSNPNLKYDNGKHFLEMAIFHSGYDECKMLLEHGADINLFNIGKSYEINSANVESDFYRYNKNDLIKIVDLCLEYGLDLREQMRNLI